MMLLGDLVPIYNAGRARVGREKALHKGNIHKDLQRGHLLVKFGITVS